MKLIAVFTHSGFTARLISRYRPLVPIVAFSPEQETRRRLAMIWGVYPRNIQDVPKIDGLAAVAEKRLLEERTFLGHCCQQWPRNVCLKNGWCGKATSLGS